jgi:N-acyl-L-homoserine lactone synthetase
MARVCGTERLQGLPSATTGEVSRFAISKRRRLSCKAGAMVRLGLMKGLFGISIEMGLTHWCAIMEPTLQRLLRFNAIYFQSLGPMVDFHGLRQPVYCSIADTFDRVRLNQHDMWRWATNGGVQTPGREALVA